MSYKDGPKVSASYFSEGPFRDSGGEAPVVQVSGGGQGEHAQLPRAGTGNHLQVQYISDKMTSFREVELFNVSLQLILRVLILSSTT